MQIKLNRHAVALSACFLAASLSGCASMMGQTYTTSSGQIASLPRDVDMVAFNQMAADAMLQQAKGAVLNERPILVTSLVNIDDLTDTSSFGRITGEQIGSRLTQQGYRVTEIRLRQDNVLIRRKAGEFALSRDLVHLSQNQGAQAIMVGTYAIGMNMVYVTTKLVSPVNSQVLASSNYSMPLGPNARALLGLDMPKATAKVYKQSQPKNEIEHTDWLML